MSIISSIARSSWHSSSVNTIPPCLCPDSLTRLMLPLAEKRLQRFVHFPLVFNNAMHEGLVFNAAKYRHQTGTALVLIHFGVAEHVAFLHQFLDVADTPLVVRRQVVAVGK